MCVSLNVADFTGTTISLFVTDHPIYGLIHVLGYSNTVVDYSNKPNAMLLHLPSAEPMTQANFIEHKAPSFQKDMWAALEPRAKGLSFAVTRDSSHVLVFDYGLYTVVLAKNAKDIPDALTRVPAERRPEVNQELFDYYDGTFPNWSIALCCFNNAEAQVSQPMLMWYKPKYPNLVILPGLDCHTGKIPDKHHLVEVDHRIILSDYQMQEGQDVYYSDPGAAEIQDYLPRLVIGNRYIKPLKNGDFVFSREDVLNSDMSYMRRFIPAVH